MTTDCIVIEPSIFIKLKDSPKNDKIADRIISMLETYSCFKDGPQVLSSPNHHFNPKHAGRGGAQQTTSFGGHSKSRFDHSTRKRNHHTHATSTISFVQRRPKQPCTVERDLTSMLNKLSKGNYAKLASTIKALTFATDENLTVFLSQILAKCQRQVCFINLYLSLLQDIHCDADEPMKDRIRDFVTDHVTQAVGAHAGLGSFTLQSKNYDEFCTHLIQKGDIIGNHKTILQIMELYPHMMKREMHGIESYFEDVFRQTCDIGETTSCQRNTDLHELLLEMLVDFVKLNAAWKQRIATYFSDKSKMHSYSSKARFKIMDIIN